MNDYILSLGKYKFAQLHLSQTSAVIIIFRIHNARIECLQRFCYLVHGQVNGQKNHTHVSF